MQRIEHIGIAVKNLESSKILFSKIFNKECYKTERVESEGVTTSFFQIGETKIELLESANPQSPIKKFLDKRGEGIHHIAILVDDIKKEIIRLKEHGFIIINENPVPGADNKLVCFLHPKCTNGVLIELCQEM